MVGRLRLVGALNPAIAGTPKNEHAYYTKMNEEKGGKNLQAGLSIQHIQLLQKLVGPS